MAARRPLSAEPLLRAAERRDRLLAPGGLPHAESLTSWFRERGFGTLVHPWPGPGGRVIRASAQAYNSRAQCVALAAALRQALLLDPRPDPHSGA